MNVEVALDFDNLIQGKCEIKKQIVTILYDSSAMHSFISFDYEHELNLAASDLPNVLVVSIPTDELVKTSQACLQCHFNISDRTFIADLIYLPLFGIDMIQGMDRLSVNHVMLNYSIKSIVLSFELVKSVIPIRLYLSSLELDHGKTKNKGYILLMASEEGIEQTLGEIPVLKEYLDVFPKDIHEFPPKLEVEFSIELGLRMGPRHLIVCPLQS